MVTPTQTFFLVPDGPFPNNRRLPLILYPQAVILEGSDPATVWEALFHSHHWGGCWRNGVFDFHHYHSTAHEVLGVYRGTARVRFGGPQGIDVAICAGAAVVIPAGVAHQKLTSTPDFAVVGAYPRGQIPDMCYGRPGERQDAETNIQTTPSPESDPVCGRSKGLMRLWYP